jgi:hypothetical protein
LQQKLICLILRFKVPVRTNFDAHIDDFLEG